MKIKQMDIDELEKSGVFGWPVWECECSEFDWHYDRTEHCYFLEGAVTVQLPDGTLHEVKEGDYVIFEKNLDCRWNVKKKIRKHYNFE